jgi:hypothetical protein
MVVEIVMWIAAVGCGAILQSAIPRRDVAQAGGAFGLLVMSFQYQFGSDLSRPAKLAVAVFLTVGLATWWRLTRPVPALA